MLRLLVELRDVDGVMVMVRALIAASPGDPLRRSLFPAKFLRRATKFCALALIGRLKE